MYYILLVIALVIVYSFVVKVLSSVLKGILIAVGVVLLVGGIYVFILSSSKPVEILSLYEVDNFRVRKIEK